MTAGTFAAVAVTLTAAHWIADHVLGQTDKQACNKAKPGWEGWRHIAGHVFLYHLVMWVMLTVAVGLLNLDVSWWGLGAGMAFSAVTHAVIDRRWPVRRLLELTGSAPFARLASNGMNGMYLSDQALHMFCLWVSALLVVSIGA